MPLPGAGGEFKHNHGSFITGHTYHSESCLVLIFAGRSEEKPEINKVLVLTPYLFGYGREQAEDATLANVAGTPGCEPLPGGDEGVGEVSGVGEGAGEPRGGVGRLRGVKALGGGESQERRGWMARKRRRKERPVMMLRKEGQAADARATSAGGVFCKNSQIAINQGVLCKNLLATDSTAATLRLRPARKGGGERAAGRGRKLRTSQAPSHPQQLIREEIERGPPSQPRRLCLQAPGRRDR
nr:unnamed protein product [Digitaria exilis]